MTETSNVASIERVYPPYNVMIARLFKTMPDVPYASAMHAAIGIAGEAAELLCSTTRKNIIEECGDLEFYIEAFKQHCNEKYADTIGVISMRGVPQLINSGNVFQNIVVLGGDILDLTKKSWVYGKPLAEIELTELIQTLETNMAHMYEMVGTSKAEVCHLNQVKLIGPTGRFASGFYSDAAAIERADKAVGEDRKFMGKESA